MRNYNSIDLMKFVMALCVVTIHTYIVDGMNKDTLSCVYPTMRKLFRKNVITYLQTYIKSDILYGIEIANTYGADVIKLLLEY